MLCPICARSLEPATSAELECARCRAVLRVGADEIVVQSLGRVPAGLRLDTRQAGATSYRTAGVGPSFVVHRRWRKPDMIVPVGLCMPALVFLAWARSRPSLGVIETMLAVMTAVVSTLTVFAVWYLVAYALNRSTLRVSGEALRLSTGPVPWPWRPGVTLTASPGLRVRPVAIQREVKDRSPHMRKVDGPVMSTRWWSIVASGPKSDLTLFRQLDFEQAHFLAERIRRTLRA